MLGGLGTETLRPIHQVLRELEDEIKGLWQPHQGQQLVRELERKKPGRILPRPMKTIGPCGGP